VLCIACANVANLILVRGAIRSREVAIRAALGGDRWSLARPLLVESLLLALFGGGAGILMASFGVDALLAIARDRLPRAAEIEVNTGVVLFALGLSLVSAVLFGMVPALANSRANLHEALNEGGRAGGATRSDKFRRALVVGEVALALTLLVGAGLLIRSFSRVAAVDPGFDPRGILTFTVAVPQSKYADPPAQRRFFEDALARIRNLPGIESAGTTTVLPFSGDWSTGSFTVEGFVKETSEFRPWGDVRIVSPGYLETLRVQLIKGRMIESTDATKAPAVAVIDEELSRRFFAGRDPIGGRITFDDSPSQTTQWITVVGVVRHTAHEGLDAKARVQLYLPVAQAPYGTQAAYFAVRSSRPPMTLVADMRAAIRAADPQQPIANAKALEELIHESMGQRRLALLLLGVFAGLALVLASLGIYGVISHNVAQRTRELGIRMALGAAQSNVLGLVIRQGLRLTAIGISLGALAAIALTRVMQSQLYEVQPTDPTTFVLTALLLGAVALVAALVPALRATRVDPAVALRAE